MRTARVPMAVQPDLKMQAVRPGPCTRPDIPAWHKLRYRAVLAQIPLAVAKLQSAHTARRAACPPSTVFVIDWDDTCCATSFLERCGFMADLDSRIDELAPALRAHLLVLEMRVLSLLKTAVELGTVLIVTNAGDGWVDLSSSRFLPSVRAFLDRHYKSIKVISARSRYIEEFPLNPLQWKARTFFHELQLIYVNGKSCMGTGPPLNVVVLGDSIGDQYAAHIAGHELAVGGVGLTLKFVKFLERPSIEQLCSELAVLLDHIYAMTVYPSSFDVSMYKEGAHDELTVAQQSQEQQQTQPQSQQPLPDALEHIHGAPAPAQVADAQLLTPMSTCA